MSRLGLTACLLVVTMAMLAGGCYYFRSRPASPEQIQSLTQVGMVYKRFIFHYGSAIREMKDLTADSVSLKGSLQVPAQPIYYTPDRSKVFKMKEEERRILHEVHFFMKEGVEIPQSGEITIPYSDLKEVTIIDFDSGTTLATHTLGGLTASAVAGALGLALVALIKGSCPYIYVQGGDIFYLEGEVFGGARMPNMEREDLLPLPHMIPEGRSATIRIANELKERQHINLARLMVVEHDPAVRVLTDQFGCPTSYVRPVSPLEGVNRSGADILDLILDKDSMVYAMEDDRYDIGSLDLRFSNPDRLDRARLLLKAKNTLWGEHVIERITSKFGGYYETWIDRQSRLPAEERARMMAESHVPLTVRVKEGDRWEVVYSILPVGPMGYREFLIEIPADSASEWIDVRLETGFMFWEIDWVALDTSHAEGLPFAELVPTSATSSRQSDIVYALANDDEFYFDQLEVGEVAEVTFTLTPPSAGKAYSYFLRAKGYYEPIRDYAGPPRVNELIRFRNLNHVPRFSREEYFRLTGKEERLAALEEEPLLW